MLLNEPLFYYKEILKVNPNSYLAEDETQAIIGIDVVYLEGEELDELKINIQNKQNLPKFAGLFGVISYEMIHKFEKIGNQKNKIYNFPNYLFADAKAYLHYDKQSKIYTQFGEKKYFENLENKQTSTNKDSYFYEILNQNQWSEFQEEFKQAIEYIKSGDVFQIVLSKTLHLRSNLPTLDFYQRLKSQNPSPYMYHFPTPYGDVVGSSPELVVSLKNREISVSPIAGTRSRGIDANDDERISKELLNDEKELAEHRMLVDLARNDVGKVAEISSVCVQNPMHIKKFEKVIHIVSDVKAILRQDCDWLDLVKATFPAGTLSGSPKIRAMQIINKLEKHQRLTYGGAIGFVHFSGDMQLAITIRSATFVKENVFIGAGAGIVFDSVDKFEYDEICKKRGSCLSVFEALCEKI